MQTTWALTQDRRGAGTPGTEGPGQGHSELSGPGGDLGVLQPTSWSQLCPLWGPPSNASCLLCEEAGFPQDGWVPSGWQAALLLSPSGLSLPPGNRQRPRHPKCIGVLELHLSHRMQGQAPLGSLAGQHPVPRGHVALAHV